MNIIRLKRSTTTPAPTTLLEGEVAYSFLSRTLFIGAPLGTIEAVAGAGAFAKLTGAVYSGAHAFTGAQLTAATPPAGSNNTSVATTAFVQAALSSAGGGNMLTGVYDTNSSGVVDNAERLGGALAADYALKTYVDARISALVGGAGAALDTLKELGDALGNNPGAVASLTTAVGARLEKAENLADLQNAQAARTNLGLGDLGTQNSVSVSITGGSISGVTLDNLTLDFGVF